MQTIHGRSREITFFVSRFISQIRFAVVLPGVPESFFRIDKVKPLVVGLVEPNFVKDVELWFRAAISQVSDAGLIEVCFGPEPLSMKMGLGINVTVLLFILATFFTTYLYFITLSAILARVLNRMVISD